MRTCQESIDYLFSLGISISKIADLCGVTRVYMSMIKNGHKQGGEDLQVKLADLCLQAQQQGMPVKRSAHRPEKRITPYTRIVDAIPATGYSTSQEIIPYDPGQEDIIIIPEPPTRNRRAPHPIYDRPVPTVHTPPARPGTLQAKAFEQARAGLKGAFIRNQSTGRELVPGTTNSLDVTSYRETSLTPDQTSTAQQPAQVSQAPERISKWQQLKATYHRGNEIQRQDWEALKRRRR